MCTVSALPLKVNTSAYFFSCLSGLIHEAKMHIKQHILMCPLSSSVVWFITAITTSRNGLMGPDLSHHKNLLAGKSKNEGLETVNCYYKHATLIKWHLLKEW